MIWIYLSPHLDDAILSCGGLIAAQTDAGNRVEVWTLCAGDPPPGPLSAFAHVQHQKWQLDRDAVSHRRLEDKLACQAVGARVRHFSIPDAIYRRAHDDRRTLYNSDAEIFGPLADSEQPLIADLSQQMQALLVPDAVLVGPLSIGGHVDHRLARAAARTLGIRMWHYADVPYALAGGKTGSGDLVWPETSGMEAEVFGLSERQFMRWPEAILAYASQAPVLWPSVQAMRRDLVGYHNHFGGVPLWGAAAGYPIQPGLPGGSSN